MREDGKSKGKKEGLAGRNTKDCGRKLSLEVFMAHKRLWNIAKKRMLEDSAVLPNEDGNHMRENRAMHEEHFLSSWRREDVEREEG